MCSAQTVVTQSGASNKQSQQCWHEWVVRTASRGQHSRTQCCNPEHQQSVMPTACPSVPRTQRTANKPTVLCLGWEDRKELSDPKRFGWENLVSRRTNMQRREKAVVRANPFSLLSLAVTLNHQGYVEELDSAPCTSLPQHDHRQSLPTVTSKRTRQTSTQLKTGYNILTFWAKVSFWITIMLQWVI